MDKDHSFRGILSKQRTFNRHFFKFLELHYYVFCLLDPCHENGTDITLFCVVYGFIKCREGKVPHSCFATHITQNKELLWLKQGHLKIGYTGRTVSFNAFNR